MEAVSENIEIFYSSDALLPYSVDIGPKKQTAHLSDLSQKFISELQQNLQALVDLWKTQGVSDSYMLLGVDKLQESEPFHFQAVPYESKNWVVLKVWQQFLVLWRFTFGGLGLSADRISLLDSVYTDFGDVGAQIAAKVGDATDCAFCDNEVIDSQIVFKGRSFNILYNYAPIGLGKEKLHFLIVSKEHRPDFEMLTEEEHTEAFELSQMVTTRLQEHFTENSLSKLYIYHKTGDEAGQSVKHWHMHLVFTQNIKQDIWGRLTVLRNILFGAIFSFRLSKEALAKQQEKYSAILNREI